MAWYRNQYVCYHCSEIWEDEWSCGCDDDCPSCDARHASPVGSEDLTFVIEDERHCFVVLKSPPEADDHPDYREVIRFLSKGFAEAYIRAEPTHTLV
ncbi:hypothetical protein ASD44_08260 [Mesorhizobium sp. Root554]|nr:hypothetical protein ASD27_08270 [Mesorhizobium sp. Root1471]KQZ36584.1 hypothetical protein ASD44_08260 [Mesorhizobium sp. Root554]